MPDDRYLVTGVLGCLGAWVAHLLVEEGADVVGFDLGTSPAACAS
jgi:nucleoside-diphosphate-sugar epimerase